MSLLLDAVHHHYIEGSSKDHKALIIAGVHGSEISGVEVVSKWLFEKLASNPPFFTVQIIPALFEENYKNANKNVQNRKPASDSNEYREVRDPTEKNGVNYPNRNFPAPGQSLSHVIKRDGGKSPKDCGGRKIMDETIFLIALINTFKPTRIASVHGHRVNTLITSKDQKGKVELPGIFVDPVANYISPSFPISLALAQKTVGCIPYCTPPSVPSSGRDFGSDDKLALEMARYVRKKQNEFLKVDVANLKKKEPNFVRRGEDWVMGNFLDFGGVYLDAPQIRYPPDPQAVKQGYSLGNWAPCSIKEENGSENRPGIPVITVEVRHYEPSTLTYYNDRPKEKAAREAELQAHADALLNVFLAKPQTN